MKTWKPKNEPSKRRWTTWRPIQSKGNDGLAGLGLLKHFRTSLKTWFYHEQLVYFPSLGPGPRQDHARYTENNFHLEPRKIMGMRQCLPTADRRRPSACPPHRSSRTHESSRSRAPKRYLYPSAPRMKSTPSYPRAMAHCNIWANNTQPGESCLYLGFKPEL